MDLIQLKSALNLLADLSEEELKERAPKLYKHIQDSEGAGHLASTFVVCMASIVNTAAGGKSKIAEELKALAA